MTEWNENLTPRREKKPSNKGGQGSIESLDKIENIIWQSRSAAPSEYENALGDALEDVMADGTHDIEGIVAGLSTRRVKAQDGSEFTVESFKEQLRRLA